MADNPVACPFDTATSGATMPCEQDTVVNTLRELLGRDYVNAFLIDGQSPATVVSSGNDLTTLAVTLGTLSNLAITAAILILAVSIWKWVTNSSNDGEAVGISDRGALLGMFGRPLFALTLLAPTASGFPVINIIIMTVVLWANGATNSLYATVAERYIKPPSMDISNGNSDVFIAASDVTDAYVVGALQGYCLLRMKQEGANIQVKGKADPEKNAYTLSYRDSSATLAEKKADLCGSYTIERSNVQDFLPQAANKLLNGNAADKEVFQSILTVQKIQAVPMAALLQARAGYAALAYVKGLRTALGKQAFNEVFTVSFNYIQTDAITGNPSAGLVNITNASVDRINMSRFLLGRSTSELTKGYGSIVTLPAEPWSTTPEADKIESPVDITSIIKDAPSINEELYKDSMDIVKRSKEHINTNRDVIQNAMDSVRNILFSKGWMNAGNAQAKLRQMTAGIAQKISHKPYKVKYSVGIAPQSIQEESATLAVVNNINATVAAASKAISDELPSSHPAQITLSAQVASATLASNGDNLTLIDNMSWSLTGGLHNMNEALISTIINVDKTQQDTLSRIQSFGEWMLVAIASILAAMVALRIYLGSVMTATEAVASATFGVAGGLSAAAKNFNDLVDSILLSPLKELMDSFFLISRIFGVVIPSMPYVFLILAGVGWFIQIIQTMFGMPLWLIMHSIPEKSFIGSQQQGYVTLLALLFRPILIISGFFVAFDLYDPLVVFATTAFFDSYGTISGSSSSHSVSQFMIYLASLKYWYYLYAGVLMGITFLVFGLVQELSDSVLDWLGTNLLRGFGNMDSKSTMQGVTSAMSQSAAKNSQKIASNLEAKRLRGGGGGGGGGDGDGDGDGGGGKNVTGGGPSDQGSGNNPVIQRSNSSDGSVNNADQPPNPVVVDNNRTDKDSSDSTTSSDVNFGASRLDVAQSRGSDEAVNDSGSSINDQSSLGDDYSKYDQDDSTNSQDLSSDNDSVVGGDSVVGSSGSDDQISSDTEVSSDTEAQNADEATGADAVNTGSDSAADASAADAVDTGSDNVADASAADAVNTGSDSAADASAADAVNTGEATGADAVNTGNASVANASAADAVNTGGDNVADASAADASAENASVRDEASRNALMDSDANVSGTSVPITGDLANKGAAVAAAAGLTAGGMLKNKAFTTSKDGSKYKAVGVGADKSKSIIAQKTPNGYKADIYQKGADGSDKLISSEKLSVSPNGDVTATSVPVDARQPTTTQTTRSDGTVTNTSIPASSDMPTTSATFAADGTALSDSSVQVNNGITTATSNDYENNMSSYSATDGTDTFSVETDHANNTVTTTASNATGVASETYSGANLIQTTESDLVAGTSNSVSYATDQDGNAVPMASQITTPTSQTSNDFNASDNSVVSTVTPLGANGAPSGEPSVESFKNSHITPTGEVGSLNNNDQSVTGNASTGGQNMGISTGSKRLDSIAAGLLVGVTALGGGDTDTSGSPIPKGKSKAVNQPSPVPQPPTESMAVKRHSASKLNPVNGGQQSFNQAPEANNNGINAKRIKSPNGSDVFIPANGAAGALSRPSTTTGGQQPSASSNVADTSDFGGGANLNTGSVTNTNTSNGNPTDLTTGNQQPPVSGNVTDTSGFNGSGANLNTGSVTNTNTSNGNPTNPTNPATGIQQSPSNVANPSGFGNGDANPDTGSVTNTNTINGGTARETVAVAPIGNRVFKPIQPIDPLKSSNTGRPDSSVNTTSTTVGGGQRTTIASPHVKRTAAQSAALNSQLAKNKDVLNKSQKLKQSSKAPSAIDLTSTSKKIISSSVVNSASALKVGTRQEVDARQEPRQFTAANNPTSRQGDTVIEEQSEDEEKSVTNGKAINKPSSSSSPPSS